MSMKAIGTLLLTGAGFFLATKEPTSMDMQSIKMQNKMNPMEKQITQLLQGSINAFHQNGSVDSITTPFAKAQRLIHSDNFKNGIKNSEVRQQIVEDFANIGYKLSE